MYSHNEISNYKIPKYINMLKYAQHLYDSIETMTTGEHIPLVKCLPVLLLASQGSVECHRGDADSRYYRRVHSLVVDRR